VSAFKQQQIWACQPILSPRIVIISLLAIGIFMLPLGIGIYVSTQKVVEYNYRYDDQCPPIINGSTNTCTIEFNIGKKMSKPIFVYHQLTHFYQNHRRFVGSIDFTQLSGTVYTQYSQLSLCDPIKSFNNSHNESNFFIPCGLVAYSVFNDTFSIASSNGSQIALSTDNIAWSSDKDKYKNPKKLNISDILHSPLNLEIFPNFIEDEKFMVWARISALPDFRKLAGVIQQTLDPGTSLNITIENRYPTAEFNGEKHLILSTASWVGGRNTFLGIAYIIVGGGCIGLAGLFFILNIVRPKKLDQRYNMY